MLLHGHGQRGRRVGIPTDTNENVEVLELLLRRYACQRCKAIIVVGPRGLLRGRHYSAMAIALALWLWAVYHRSDATRSASTLPRPRCCLRADAAMQAFSANQSLAGWWLR
ncbi:hypothetical protein [Enhygromyxa salina]|uniref:hypothetical protein n=1 Tax=Enhygromyxa salina TaxID=215803 RepID=UPI000D04451E|nr:hypothetical protein [Enhygromyxa salina]